MKYFLPFLFLPFFSNCFCQNNKKNTSENDSAFIEVPLHDFKSTKILILEAGEKARIYLSGDSILKNARQLKSYMPSLDSEYKKAVSLLDSAFREKDTLVIEFVRLTFIQSLIGKQLKIGNAKVYYKREKVFVDSIFHRLERFAGNADRFFYLPNKRTFFYVHEYSGIIDAHTNFFSSNRYEEYRKEAEKLLKTFEE